MTIDMRGKNLRCNGWTQKILLLGRAGIGKSTFCRYVVYQWATASYWSQYELLTLLPLRRLRYKNR
jgi:GTPase SAR1 family protein